MSRPLVVILGGTRSGKSRFGRDRAAALAGDGPVTFVATALPGDAEMDERIAMHRRGSAGRMGDDRAGPRPARRDPGRSRRDDDPARRADPLAEPARRRRRRTSRLWSTARSRICAPPSSAHDGPVVVVSDEIGLGLVPMDALSRAFRDLLGIAHQRLVADSDEAWFMVAGRAIRLVEPAAAAR